jgi:hypothetical protein
VGFDRPVARTDEGAPSQGRLVCRNAGSGEMKADVVAENESKQEEPKLSRKPVLDIVIVVDRSGLNTCCLMIAAVVLLIQRTSWMIVDNGQGVIVRRPRCGYRGKILPTLPPLTFEGQGLPFAAHSFIAVNGEHAVSQRLAFATERWRNNA